MIKKLSYILTLLMSGASQYAYTFGRYAACPASYCSSTHLMNTILKSYLRSTPRPCTPDKRLTMDGLIYAPLQILTSNTVRANTMQAVVDC